MFFVVDSVVSHQDPPLKANVPDHQLMGRINRMSVVLRKVGLVCVCKKNIYCFSAFPLMSDREREQRGKLADKQKPNQKISGSCTW